EVWGGVGVAGVGAKEQQDVPCEGLVEELKLERSLSYGPLVQVMFAFHNAPRRELALPGLAVETVEVHAGTAALDLTLDVWPVDGGGLAGAVEYSLERFDRTTLQRLVGHFRHPLAGVLARPDRRASPLPPLGRGRAARVV